MIERVRVGWPVELSLKAIQDGGHVHAEALLFLNPHSGAEDAHAEAKLKNNHLFKFKAPNQNWLVILSNSERRRIVFPKFEWPGNDAVKNNGYRVFPAELENDPLVAFHGTSEVLFRGIEQRNGFIPSPGLESASFGRQSPTALEYACKKRGKGEPGYIVVARFASLNQKKVVFETSVIHLYDFENQPTIIGVCVVPPDYEHI